MEPGPHAELLADAIRADGDAFRAMFAGRGDDAVAQLREAADLYRSSW
jgi:hypothetical protein